MQYFEYFVTRCYKIEIELKIRERIYARALRTLLMQLKAFIYSELFRQRVENMVSMKFRPFILYMRSKSSISMLAQECFKTYATSTRWNAVFSPVG